MVLTPIPDMNTLTRSPSTPYTHLCTSQLSIALGLIIHVWLTGTLPTPSPISAPALQPPVGLEYYYVYLYVYEI